MSRYVTAIDIGTTKVITLVGERTSSGVKIVAYSEAPTQGVSRGEVINIKKALESLMPTLESVKEQLSMNPDALEYRIGDVYVGISGKKIRSFNQTLSIERPNPNDMIRKDEVQSMLEQIYASEVEPREQIHYVVPQSYNVDENIGQTEIEGMVGESIEGDYKLFVGSKTNEDQMTNLFNRARLNVKKFIFTPIATAQAVISDDEKELGCAIIDLGGGTTGVTVYHKNIIRHAAIIPFGGNSVTEDISQICGVSFKNAETLKTVHGNCVSEFAPENKYISILDKSRGTSKQVAYKKLALVIEARMCEILTTARYELEQAGYLDRIGSVILTGGGAQMAYIKTLTRAIFPQKDVKVATAENNIIPNSSDAARLQTSATTAVGLIIKALDYDLILPDSPVGTTLFGDDPVFESTADEPKQLKAGNSKPHTPKPPRPKITIGGIMDNLFGSGSNDNEA